MKATGKFSVALQPIDTYTKGHGGNSLNRMSIDKVFKGDLLADSKGEMLSVMTAVSGSAGYVAIEQVSGTLNGKQGSFVLQHYGMMANGENRLVLEVVPNSGTGELTGLAGKMEIGMEEEQHVYAFTYAVD